MRCPAVFWSLRLLRLIMINIVCAPRGKQCSLVKYSRCSFLAACTRVSVSKFEVLGAAESQVELSDAQMQTVHEIIPTSEMLSILGERERSYWLDHAYYGISRLCTTAIISKIRGIFG